VITPVVLSGAVVRLEPLTAAHAADLAAAAVGDRSSYPFTRVPDGLADAEAYVAAALADQAAGRALPFAVRRLADGMIVGSTRFLDLEVFSWPPPGLPGSVAGPEPTDERPPSVVEIGSTWYAAAAQRSAVNTEAKLLLLTQAFEVWRVLRVTLKTDARNLASRAAIERLGARAEGVRRAHAPATDGTVRDTAYYSLTAAEWPAVRARLTERLHRPAPAPGPAPAPELILTGERTLPGIAHENYWFRRHEAAYLALLPFVRGARRVLEAGSGEGYGADLLATAVPTVLAVELDPAAAAHARAAYPRVRVLRADLQALPLADASVDVVASLQTLEHLHDQPAFLAECARVLVPGGRLLLTTPNAATFPPGNPFHTRELRMAELLELLAPHVVCTHRWGVRHGVPLSRADRYDGDLITALVRTPEPGWPPALRARVEAVTARSFDVGPFRESDLDLVVVGRRRGGPGGG